MAWSCWELWGYVWLNSSLTPFCIYAGWFLNVMYYSKNQAEQFVFFCDCWFAWSCNVSIGVETHVRPGIWVRVRKLPLPSGSQRSPRSPRLSTWPVNQCGRPLGESWSQRLAFGVAFEPWPSNGCSPNMSKWRIHGINFCTEVEIFTVYLQYISRHRILSISLNDFR